LAGEHNYDRAKGSFKAWLFTVTRRRVVDQFRRRARQPGNLQNSAVPWEDIPDPTEDPLVRLRDEKWSQNQIQIASDRVRRRVAPGQWQPFDLTALKGWTTQRISARLGSSRAQVYMAKMRIGRALKAEIEKLG